MKSKISFLCILFLICFVTPSFPAEVTHKGGGGGSVSDEAYDATSWNNVTSIAPSKNAVRDKIEGLAAAPHTHTHTAHFSKTITNPAAADDYLLMKFNPAATITKVTGIHEGGTSVTFNIQECDSAGANCANNLTSCTTLTSGVDCAIGDATIDANDWIKLTTESVSGSVLYWTFTIVYTITE